jgi:hypothetical protein
VTCLGNIFGTSFTAKFRRGLKLGRLASFFFLPLNAFLRIYCAVIQRVERLQARKLFFVAPQRKLRFSKAQLRSLSFQILGATFNRIFYDWIWYGETYLDWLL